MVGLFRYALHVGVLLGCVVASTLVLMWVVAAMVFGWADDATLLRGFALGAGLWIGGMSWGVLMNDVRAPRK